MLRRSKTSNRLWLFIIGVPLLVGGAAGLWGSLGSDTLGLPLPEDGASLADLGELPEWFAWALLAISVALIIASICWFAAAVPRPERVHHYLLQHDGATGLTELRTKVLSNAVENHCRTVPGVVDATTHIGGSAQYPELSLRVEVDERSNIPYTLESVKTVVLPSLAQTIGAELAAARIVLDPVRRTRTSKYATVESWFSSDKNLTSDTWSNADQQPSASEPEDAPDHIKAPQPS